MEENLEEKQQNKENLECKASGLSRSGSKTILAKRLPSQKLVSMPTDAQVLLWQQHHMGSEAGKAQFQTTKLVRIQRAKECEAWAEAQIQHFKRTLNGKEAQLKRELQTALQKVDQLSKRRGIFQDINSMGKLTRQQYKKELVRRLGLGCRYKDTDVFHIIGSKNGGADHAHNYLFMLGSSFNRTIKHHFDDLNCFIAGLHRTKMAVKVSLSDAGFGGTLESTLQIEAEASRRVERGRALFKHLLRLRS
jgi:hypothetical protein